MGYTNRITEIQWAELEPWTEVPAGAIDEGDVLWTDDELEHRVAVWTQLESGQVVLNIDVSDGSTQVLSCRPGVLLKVHA